MEKNNECVPKLLTSFKTNQNEKFKAILFKKKKEKRKKNSI